MISYAQNFEDVMLWRALKHVENGFYIDVGANDPNIESVTKTFYERGWHGINIEPLSTHFADLQNQRPRDINIRCAGGATAGEIEIWECDVRGWASVDKEAIARHIARGNVGRYQQVPMIPLSTICNQHAPPDIHFLKIDVEGFEHAVLLGMDFQSHRPWVIVIEATRPNTQEEVFLQWQELLLDASYRFIYADGLNRFYLACEHPELAAAFKYPPNVFDNYVSAWQIQAQQAQQAQKIQAEESAALLEESAALLHQEQVKVTQLQTALQLVYASTSWRMSLPLRVVSSLLKRLASGSRAAKTLLKAKIKLVLVDAKLYIVGRPRLSRVASALFFSFPALEKKLRQITMSELPVHAKYIHSGFDPHSLTKDAQAIYQDLKLAMAEQTKVTH